MVSGHVQALVPDLLNPHLELQVQAPVRPPDACGTMWCMKLLQSHTSLAFPQVSPRALELLSRRRALPLSSTENVSGALTVGLRKRSTYCETKQDYSCLLDIDRRRHLLSQLSLSTKCHKEKLEEVSFDHLRRRRALVCSYWRVARGRGAKYFAPKSTAEDVNATGRGTRALASVVCFYLWASQRRWQDFQAPPPLGQRATCRNSAHSPSAVSAYISHQTGNGGESRCRTSFDLCKCDADRADKPKSSLRRIQLP